MKRRGYEVKTLNGASDISLARSSMATEALEEGFEETLWVDSDIGFDPDDADKLRAHNRPIVAGLYVRKPATGFAARFRPGEVVFGLGGGLVEMEKVGMGFTLIRAEVYEAVRKACDLFPVNGGYDGKKVVPYFLPMLAEEPAGLCYLSEDYSFIYRARQAGIVTYADTTIKLGHIGGGYAWSWDDLGPKEQYQQLRVNFEEHRAGENA